MNIRLASLTGVLALAACGGGGSNLVSTQPVVPSAPQAYAGPLGQTQFFLRLPGTSNNARKPQYVTANVASVTVTLTSVNGGAPPSGLTTSVTTNISAGSCSSGCTINGPASPPGSDNFTLTTFDASGGGGNAISTASPTLAIAVGVANSSTITLLGVPKSFSITSVPSATAGTAFGSAATLSLAVKDADGVTITGTYASPVTVTDSDASSLTQGSALSVNGGAAASSIQSNASSDVIKLSYGGLAIAPATLTAGATGATNGTASFAPALSAIVYSGPLVSTLPEIDLYAATGTGSSATFTASEVGWTNAPYNRSITATQAGACSTIATTSPASGTSFTTTAVASPTAGTCTLTLSDFASGQTKGVTLTYTTSGFGVQ
ncbi:MAG: hypothetical protein NVSMB31_02350 [Vulcanimicrobiaceae bacterium]